MSDVVLETSFAKKAAVDEIIYAHLAKKETVPEFGEVLTSLSVLAKKQSIFWAERCKCNTTDVRAGVLPACFRTMRVIFGLTITAKFLFRRKKKRIAAYKTYCATCAEEDRQRIDRLAEEMEAVISGIREERVRFFSNIILGFNDALIELTGAFVAFSFALKEPRLVMIGGLITGVSASLSMAASAFLQARHEEGKNPVKAALFTGLSYLVMAIILTVPFVLSPSVGTALAFMSVIVVLIIGKISFYSALLLDRAYLKQFGEMFALSVGVAVIAFFIGSGISILTE